MNSESRPRPSGRAPGWGSRDWHSLALVLLVGAVIFLPALGSHSIIDTSEGYYSEASREMYESGDYIVPHLNYRPWHEKPVLTYWLTSACYHAFGVNELAARLPSALCGIFTAALLFVMGRRFLSRRAALLSALVLLSAPLFLLIGRMSLTDMPFTACVSAALFGLFCAVEGAPTGYAVFGYIALGLGLLTKGPLALVLTGLVLFPYLLWTCPTLKEWKLKVARLRPIMGIGLLILVAAPWYVAVSLATNGSFAHDFFISQNLGRAAGAVNHRNLAPWFYLPVFLGGSAPWSIMLLPGVPALLRFRRTRDGASRRTRIVQFCAIWLVMVFLFFTVVPTKLATYIVPVLPAFAVCAGASLDAFMRSRNVRRFAIVGILLCVAVVVFLALLPVLTKLIPEMFIPGALLAVALLFALALCCTTLWRNQAKRGFTYLTAVLLAVCAVSVPAGLFIYHQLHQEGFYRLVMRAAQSRANVTALGPSVYSAAFYLHRRVPHVNSEQEFQAFLNDGQDSHWVFVHKTSLPELSWAKRPCRLVESQDRWYLFAVDNEQDTR